MIIYQETKLSLFISNAVIKQTVTIELDTEVMNYFKTMASNTSIPAETIMRMYLTECMKNNKQLKVSWE